MEVAGITIGVLFGVGVIAAVVYFLLAQGILHQIKTNREAMANINENLL